MQILGLFAIVILILTACMTIMPQTVIQMVTTQTDNCIGELCTYGQVQSVFAVFNGTTLVMVNMLTPNSS